MFTLIDAPIFAQQQLPDVQHMLDGTMLPGVEVDLFSHSEKMFAVNTVHRGGPVRPLAKSPTPLSNVHFQSGDKQYDLFDYLTDNRVAGLLVLKDGRIAFEDYELGANSQTRWISFSMAKSVSSTLVGAALAQGLIQSIDDPVTHYVPALRGSAYEGVSVRNVLQMASGAKWNETYTDPNSDLRIMQRDMLTQKPAAVLNYMSKLSRVGAPGSIWKYNTGETYVVGALIEGATHKTLANYLSETIWSRLGMEQDATWWIEKPSGMGLAGSGIGATLRDYGRFGLMIQQDGVIEGKSIVPKGWFAEAGRPHVIGDKPVNYGYLWWPIPAGDPINNGAFQAIGIFGQHMYINPSEKLVIVVLSARSKPSGSLGLNDTAFFTSVATALHN